jgi:prephenate dehydratase
MKCELGSHESFRWWRRLLGTEHSCGSDALTVRVQHSLFVSSFVEVFQVVEKGLATYGIVPLENSVHGTVCQTLDQLSKTTLMIRAEAFLHVSCKFAVAETMC